MFKHMRNFGPFKSLSNRTLRDAKKIMRRGLTLIIILDILQIAQSAHDGPNVRIEK